MKRAAVIATRIREEIIRHQSELEDAHLSALTIVVKIDRKTGMPGALLWRPEFVNLYEANRAGQPGPEEP